MELFGTEFLMNQYFWVSMWFLVLLAIMWKFVVPAITSTLDARAHQIRTDLDKAAQLKKDAEKAMVEYDKQLKAARQEAAHMVATAKLEAEHIAQNRLKELETELNRKQAQAEAHIEQAKQKAVAELKGEVAEITLLAVEKILQQQVDKKAAEKLTTEAMKNLMN